MIPWVFHSPSNRHIQLPMIKFTGKGPIWSNGNRICIWLNMQCLYFLSSEKEDNCQLYHRKDFLSCNSSHRFCRSKKIHFSVYYHLNHFNQNWFWPATVLVDISIVIGTNLFSATVINKAKIPVWSCVTAAAAGGEQILLNRECCLQRLRVLGPMLFWEARWIRTQAEDIYIV